MISFSWARLGAPGAMLGSPETGMKSKVGTERMPKACANSS